MADLNAILEGAPDAMDALVAGDAEHWKELAEYLLLDVGDPASPAVVTGLLEREPELARLFQRAQAALAQTRSDLYMTTLTAMRAVRPWLAAGIAATLSPAHPAALEVRYHSELMSAEGGAAAARALVADLRGATAARLLPDALVLLARRSLEEADWDAAIGAASEAEELSAGDAKRVGTARRLRGAALLSLERFADAFALLDSAMTETRPPVGGASRSRATPGPRESAIDEAATVALWAGAITPEWVRALGGMAERCGGDDLSARFEATLAAMVDGSKNPASDLEVVIRQAGQRRLHRTVEAARAIAAARELDPDAEWNPHFG